MTCWRRMSDSCSTVCRCSPAGSIWRLPKRSAVACRAGESSMTSSRRWSTSRSWSPIAARSTRFRLLEILRQFGEERAGRAAARPSTPGVVTSTTSSAGRSGPTPASRVPTSLRWHRAFLAEWPNLRNAFSWSCELDDGDAALPAAARRSVVVGDPGADGGRRLVRHRAYAADSGSTIHRAPGGRRRRLVLHVRQGRCRTFDRTLIDLARSEETGSASSQNRTSLRWPPSPTA